MFFVFDLYFDWGYGILTAFVRSAVDTKVLGINLQIPNPFSFLLGSRIQSLNENASTPTTTKTYSIDPNREFA